jgi:hypothetical protein
MLAVLIDAMNVLHSWHGRGNNRKRHHFVEAAQWVNTRGTGNLFSFDSVCDALEINSELLRSRLCELTVTLSDSFPRPTRSRLRLGEPCRSERMTVNRMRRLEHRCRRATSVIISTSDPVI